MHSLRLQAGSTTKKLGVQKNIFEASALKMFFCYWEVRWTLWHWYINRLSSNM